MTSRMTRATSGGNGHGYGWRCSATPGKGRRTRHDPEPRRALSSRPLRATTRRRGQMHMQARIGMKLMRIIEGDRDKRVETEDHG